MGHLLLMLDSDFRYSDFLVSEIDLNGQVVQLTNFDLPTEKVVVKVNMGQLIVNIQPNSNVSKTLLH